MPVLGSSRLAIAAATLVVALTACDRSAPPVESPPDVPDGVVRLTDEQVESAAIETVVAEPQSLRQVVRVPGSVASPDTARAVLGSIVEGRVVRVTVVPGDRVRRGESLVEIHTHELADAQAALTSAKAEADFQARALDRAERLHEAGAISLQELQRRQADDEAARAEQLRAQEMVDHLYPTRDGNSSVVAPRSGVVFSVDAQQGQAVLPGTPLVSMGSTTVLWVTAFVPENTSSALRPGDVVAIDFGSAPGARTTGRLVRLSDYVDPTNRSVEMRFELDSIPPGVRPGSFATVDVASDVSFDGLELAEEAAVRVGAVDVVFLEERPGEYRTHPVRVTSLRPGRVAVEGVPAGAVVVVDGAYFLKSALDSQRSEGGEAS